MGGFGVYHNLLILYLYLSLQPTVCYCFTILALFPENEIGAPLPVHCASSQFHCGANECVDGVKVCDFTTDCPNGEDESNCCE